MKKAISLALIILITITLPSCVEQGVPEHPFEETISLDIPAKEIGGYSLSSNSGEIAVSESVYDSGSLKTVERTYLFPDGDLFDMLRFEASGAGETVRFVKSFEGKAGSYRYFDKDTGTWEVRMLEGDLPLCNIYITIDGIDMILIPPLAYSRVEAGTIREVPECNGRVGVSRYNGMFHLEYEIPLTPGTFADTLLLESTGPLIDWQDEIMQGIWTGYNLTGENRFCLDGYYYSTPSSYVPTGDGYFWLNPSAYISSRLMISGGSRAADHLSVAMLDILRANVNNEGYYPTLPKSTWLEEEYGIGPGFYDTRFNTDIFNAYLIGFQKFAIPEFLEMAVNYTAFFRSHAKNNHFSVYFKDFEGWLVSDYSYPGLDVKTHVSLNHQVSEINYLYRYSEVLKDQAAADLAFSLLQGIRYTGEDWIMPDGNLHYAYLPGGSFGMQDYPYLTYNDLFELRRIVIARSGNPDPVIQSLMDSKKAWMDSAGITDYQAD